MSDLIWWTIFLILTVILAMLSVHLCYSLVRDWCCQEPSSAMADDDDDTVTTAKGNGTIQKGILKTPSSSPPPPPYLDETDSRNLLIHQKERSNSVEVLADEGDDENEKRDVFDDVMLENLTDDAPEEPPTESSGSTELRLRPIFSSREDNKKWDLIESVWREARENAKLTEYFLGGNKHLQYFEINEVFIRCMIALSGIECGENEELRNRKNDVLANVQRFQEELKAKADGHVY